MGLYSVVELKQVRFTNDMTVFFSSEYFYNDFCDIFNVKLHSENGPQSWQIIQQIKV